MDEANEYFLLLSFDNIDTTQRTLLQAKLEKIADKWWHEQSNMWIVSGNPDAQWWVDNLMDFIPAPSNLYVFNLPTELSHRGYAAWAPPAGFRFIREVYRPDGQESYGN